MNKAALINAAVFLSCSLTAWWLTSRAGGSESPEASFIAAPAAENKPADAGAASRLTPATAPPARSGGEAVPSPPDSELSKSIALLRELESMPIKQFPALFEKEILTARNSNKLARIMSVWLERDFESYVAWIKTQPPSRTMVEASKVQGIHTIGMYYTVIEKMGSTDPGRAWNFIKELPGSGDDQRWQIIRAIVNADPQAAVEFVRKHKDALAALQNPNMGFYACDPVKTAPLLRELPAGQVRNAAARELCRSYTETADDISGAAAWFQSIPPDARKVVADYVGKSSLFGVSADVQKHLKEVWKVEEEVTK